jgi:hypothetical protein
MKSPGGNPDVFTLCMKGGLTQQVTQKIVQYFFPCFCLQKGIYVIDNFYFLICIRKNADR